MDSITNLLYVLAFASGAGAIAQSQSETPNAQFSAVIQQIDTACESDYQTLCPSAQGPERGKCLNDNKSSLTTACAQAAAQMPAPPSGDPSSGDHGAPPQGPPPNGATPPERGTASAEVAR